MIPESRTARAIYCSDKCLRQANSDRWRKKSPGYMRQYLYGLTPEQYEVLLIAQGNRCAICRSETPGGKGGWHVDHRHGTKQVRGLLCHSCNIGIGLFQEDLGRIDAAAAYLRKYLEKPLEG